MNKWVIHLDREEADPDNACWSISLNANQPGWYTDRGYQDYGLPKELAQWICDTLNESNKECPYETDWNGFKKKGGTLTNPPANKIN